jgi:hypothetical protein
MGFKTISQSQLGQQTAKNSEIATSSIIVFNSGGGGPTIANVVVTDSNYTNTFAAIETTGSYIKIYGTGFVSNTIVVVNANNVPTINVTYTSATELRVALPTIQNINTIKFNVVDPGNSKYTYLFSGYIAQYLVVGGGGGGGTGNGGGGGGAGGMLAGGTTFLPGTSYTITVGAGGITAGDGANSNLTGGSVNLTGLKGGAGGTDGYPGGTWTVGNGGSGTYGSGGGAGRDTNLSPDPVLYRTGGQGTPGQGNPGGNGPGNAGGGGGAGSAGTPDVPNGQGGNGALWPYTNSYYAGGGGGTTAFNPAGNNPSPGGGGKGGGYSGQSPAATTGTPGTGGGGGGTGPLFGNEPGYGGSGTVILAIPNAAYPTVSAPGAAVSTPASAPGMTVLTYTTPSPTSPSTFTFTA